MAKQKPPASSSAAYESELTAAFSARRCSACGGAVVAVQPGQDAVHMTLLGEPVLERRGVADVCLCMRHLCERRVRVRT